MKKERFIKNYLFYDELLLLGDEFTWINAYLPLELHGGTIY